MSHYKPYPAYKDSGVEWIGEVPEHWGLLRLANIGPLMKANGGNKEDDAETGVPCIRYGDLYTTYDDVIRNITKFISPEAEAKYTAIQYGDALFAASGETFEEIGMSAVTLSEAKAVCGGDVIVLRPHKTIDPVFLAYAAAIPRRRRRAAPRPPKPTSIRAQVAGSGTAASKTRNSLRP